MRKGESLLCNSVRELYEITITITINLPAACYRLHIIITFFFITRSRLTGTNITAYRKSFFMLTFITKLSFNLTVLKSPLAISLSLTPFIPAIFQQAQLREYNAQSPVHIKTHGLPRNRKSTTCTICWLKSVLHEEKRRTVSDSGEGTQTQQKNVSDVT